MDQTFEEAAAIGEAARPAAKRRPGVRGKKTGVPTTNDLPDFDPASIAAGNVVWAQCASFPWWPAMVLAEEDVPRYIRIKLGRKHRSDSRFILFYGDNTYQTVPLSSIIPFEIGRERFADACSGRDFKLAVNIATTSPEIATHFNDKQVKNDRPGSPSDGETSDSAPPKPKRVSRKRTAVDSAIDADVAQSPKKRANGRKPAEPATPTPRAQVLNVVEGLKKIRHVLQVNFIKGPESPGEPRATAKNVDSIKWDTIVTTLEDLDKYLRSEQCDRKALTETKIPKVLRTIDSTRYDPVIEEVMVSKRIIERIREMVQLIMAMDLPNIAKRPVPDIPPAETQPSEPRP